jgi:hypothetical protein
MPPTTTTNTILSANQLAAPLDGDWFSVPLRDYDSDEIVVQTTVKNGTATIVFEGRLDPEQDAVLLHTFSGSGYAKVAYFPEMRARCTALTGTPKIAASLGRSARRIIVTDPVAVDPNVVTAVEVNATTVTLLGRKVGTQPPPSGGPNVLALLPVVEFGDTRFASDNYVSNGIPLTDGSDATLFSMTESDVAALGVFVNGVETAAYVEAHIKARDNGTLRAVFVQVDAAPGDLIELRKGTRTLARIAQRTPIWWTAHDDTARDRTAPWKVGYPKRMALPSDSYVRKSRVMGPLMSDAQIAGDEVLNGYLTKYKAYEPNHWDKVPNGFPGDEGYNNIGGANAAWAGLYNAQAVKWIRTDRVDETYTASGVTNTRTIYTQSYTNPNNDYETWRLVWGIQAAGSTAVNYYDRVKHYFQRYAMTGDVSFILKASVIGWHWTTQSMFVPMTNGSVWSQHFHQSEGAYLYYLFTKCTWAKELINICARNSYGGGIYDNTIYYRFNQWYENGGPQGLGNMANDDRIEGRSLMNWHAADLVKCPNYENGNLTYVQIIEGALDKSFNTGTGWAYARKGPNHAFWRYEISNDTSVGFTDGIGLVSYMTAVKLDAISRIYNDYPTSLSAGVRAKIQTEVPKVANYLWDYASATNVEGAYTRRSFFHFLSRGSGDNRSWQSYDLCRMMSICFGFSYAITGDTVQRDRAVTCIRDGARQYSHTSVQDGGSMHGTKQFNEQNTGTFNSMAYILGATA